MAKRILLAGVIGGLALFIWGAISHTVIGLGNVGMQNIQKPLYETMKASISQSGFYFFPEVDQAGNVADQYKGGPTGILIYKPAGAGAPMTGQLINEATLNLVQALIAAFLLSLVTGLTRYPQRVGFVFALGVLTAIATNVEYWNWYGFPGSYTLAAMTDDMIGFMIVGLIVAALVKPATRSMQVVTAKAA